MLQTLMTPSELRQQSGNPKSKSHRELVSLPLLTRGYYVVVLLVRARLEMHSLSLLNIK
jgi:hypothetical protein